VRAPALVCVLALAACTGDAGDSGELTFEQLRDATYTGVLEEPVTLGEGRYEGEPFTSDSASRPVVTLVPDTVAMGDLDGDGIDEAVVVLAHNAGGSGVFMYLAVMRTNGGDPDNVATIRLGDRVRVSAVDIEDGRVIADLVEHAPEDPMCCPTRQVRREWLFRGGQLIGPEPETAPQGGRFSGHLVWGHESRSFTSCDDGREGWVINESGDELVEVYNELTSAPYQPMFVEVRGEWTEAPSEGFAAGFEKALRVTELIRAENEGFGCRLELNDMLFIASGNEPFWRLLIREERISMRSMDAPVEIEFPAPRMSGQPPQVAFEAAGPDSGIRISLERRRCIDTMSGARYAWAADIDIGGRHLEGCAAEGL
jgi:uncharacterized membrane protein